MHYPVQNDEISYYLTVAKIFSAATHLATKLIDIHGREISSYQHGNSFCRLLRARPQFQNKCQNCDKYCAFDGLKEDGVRIVCCHAGLSLYSVPLICDGNLKGFIICGWVRTKYPLNNARISDAARQWRGESELNAEWQKIEVIDTRQLEAAANLLSFIIKTSQPVMPQDSHSVSEPRRAQAPITWELSRNEKKLASALRYIDEHLYDELTLESVAAHVCLSANYFSRFFKKRQGVNFKTWVNQKKMQRASELLCDPSHSIDSIARKLRYAQTSYFCRVFRAAHRISPQSFRHEQRL